MARDSRGRRLALISLLLTGPLVACSDPDPQPEADPSASTATGSSSAESADPRTSASLDVELTSRLVTDELPRPREVVPLDADRLLIADQNGYVVVVEGGEIRPTRFLDVADDIDGPGARDFESGLLGFAPAPDFASTGTVYTVTTHEVGDGAVSRLTRWTADTERLVVDPDSAEVLLELTIHFFVHAGGEIVFDDEGLLYTSIGGPSRSELAQDPNDYAGTVLRIDPAGSTGDLPYGIPADNPYADGGGLPEIYALGFRNPWRLSWTPEHGLLVADAMFTDKDQQVVAAVAGGNSGYPDVRGRCWEGATVAAGCRTTAAGAAITPPALEYSADVGNIVSGVLPAPADAPAPLAGTVLVADWAGALLAATPGEAPWPKARVPLPDDVVPRSHHLFDLDVGADGTIYALTTGRTSRTGKVVALTVG